MDFLIYCSSPRGASEQRTGFLRNKATKRLAFNMHMVPSTAEVPLFGVREIQLALFIEVQQRATRRNAPGRDC